MLHDVIFLRYFIDIIFDVAGAAEGCIRPVLPKTIEASQTPVLIGLLAECTVTFIQIVIQQIRP